MTIELSVRLSAKENSCNVPNYSTEQDRRVGDVVNRAISLSEGEFTRRELEKARQGLKEQIAKIEQELLDACFGGVHIPSKEKRLRYALNRLKGDLMELERKILECGG